MPTGYCQFFYECSGCHHLLKAKEGHDLKATIVLRDDAGNSYAPVALENKGSGHHRETIVSFAKILPETKRFELVIKDVAAVKERTFVWKLE